MTTPTTFKILIICTAFEPENAIGAIRFTKLSKYLIRSGHSITVISPVLGSEVKRDDTLFCHELRSINRFIIPHSNLFQRTLKNRRNNLLQNKSGHDYIMSTPGDALRARIKARLFSYLQFVYTIVRNLDWSYQVKRFAKRSFRAGQFDVVISSYPSLSAHWAAAFVKQRAFAGKWIADFRDPINSRSVSDFILFKINTMIQNRIILKADAVTFVARDMSRVLFPQGLSKGTHISNGFDCDDLPSPELKNQTKDRIFRLCYVGGLYGGERNIEVLFEAIKELIKSKIINKHEIQILYAGKEFHILELQAKSTGLSDILVNKGYLSRAESLRLQEASDAVIVASWNTLRDQGVITGKIFEPLLLSKMVIGIINGDLPNSELGELITELDAGVVFEHGNVDRTREFRKLLEFLEKIYTEKFQQGWITSHSNQNVQRYSYSEIANNLVDTVISRVCGSN